MMMADNPWLLFVVNLHKHNQYYSKQKEKFWIKDGTSFLYLKTMSNCSRYSTKVCGKKYLDKRMKQSKLAQELGGEEGLRCYFNANTWTAKHRVWPLTKEKKLWNKGDRMLDKFMNYLLSSGDLMSLGENYQILGYVDKERNFKLIALRGGEGEENEFRWHSKTRLHYIINWFNTDGEVLEDRILLHDWWIDEDEGSSQWEESTAYALFPKERTSASEE